MGNPVTTCHPDALLALGEQDGFVFEVVGNGLGYRCGYLRVLPGHPWYGKDCDAIDATVHGSLTYAEYDTLLPAYWIGFDCAHYLDAPDPALPGYSKAWDIGGGQVRSTEYVIAECRALARQAAVAGCAVARCDGYTLQVRNEF